MASTIPHGYWVEDFCKQLLFHLVSKNFLALILHGMCAEGRIYPSFAGCSYSFKATNGTLSTDIKLNSHGKLTPSSCKWIIKSPNKGKISLHIKDLGFNKHHSCSQNYMDIYIHRKGDFELLTRLCPFNKLMWHNGLDIPTRSRQIAVKYIINKGSLSRPLQVTWTTSTPKGIH